MRIEDIGLTGIGEHKTAQDFRIREAHQALQAQVNTLIEDVASAQSMLDDGKSWAERLVYESRAQYNIVFDQFREEIRGRVNAITAVEDRIDALDDTLEDLRGRDQPATSDPGPDPKKDKPATRDDVPTNWYVFVFALVFCGILVALGWLFK